MPQRQPGTAAPDDIGVAGVAGLPGHRRPGRPAAVSPAGAADQGPDATAGEAAARQICLRMLTAAPRTRAELASALSRRRVPQETADAVLGRFAEVGLIDDAMFAGAWVESRHHGRGLAGRALAAELRQRGVADGDIEAALERLDPEQEVATARELVARRMTATAGQPLPARIRRLVGLLARRGYGSALAYRVVREALEQEGADAAAAGCDLTEAPEADQEPDLSGC